MRIKYMLCAQTIIQDITTNNFSAINILEKFTHLGGLPAIIPEFAILTRLEREENEPAEIDCSLRATIADQELFSENLSINFQASLRTRSVVRIGGLPIPSSGLLIIEFVCGALREQYEIEVVHQPPPPRVEPD